MLVVMSVMVVTLMPVGRLASSCGRIFWMELTTVMVFAPGWRWMLRITAGVSVGPEDPFDCPIQAACLVFSTPFTTLAMSFTNTGAPLL